MPIRELLVQFKSFECFHNQRMFMDWLVKNKDGTAVDTSDMNLLYRLTWAHVPPSNNGVVQPVQAQGRHNEGGPLSFVGSPTGALTYCMNRGTVNSFDAVTLFYELNVIQTNDLSMVWMAAQGVLRIKPTLHQIQGGDVT